MFNFAIQKNCRYIMIKEGNSYITMISKMTVFNTEKTFRLKPTMPVTKYSLFVY